MTRVNTSLTQVNKSLQRINTSLTWVNTGLTKVNTSKHKSKEAPHKSIIINTLHRLMYSFWYQLLFMYITSTLRECDFIALIYLIWIISYSIIFWLSPTLSGKFYSTKYYLILHDSFWCNIFFKEISYS